MPTFSEPVVIRNERLRFGTYCAYHLRALLKTGQSIHLLRLDDAPAGAVCVEPNHPPGLPPDITAGFVIALYKVGL